MKTMLLGVALALVACGGSTGEDTQKEPPLEQEQPPEEDPPPIEGKAQCDVDYSNPVSCGDHYMGAFGRCYGDKTGYAFTDGTILDCTIGDRFACDQAYSKALVYCARLTDAAR
jgi:hypothetical protein